MVCDQLTRFLEVQKLLPENQRGSRQKRSTDHDGPHSNAEGLGAKHGGRTQDWNTRGLTYWTSDHKIDDSNSMFHKAIT